jgi:hypothetical protein
MLGRRQAAPLTQCTHASYGLPPVVPAPQCIRINARPAGQTVLGYLTSDFIRDAPGSAAFLATAVGKTVLNGNLASGATRAVGAYAAGSPQKVVNEAGMLVQLLAAINKQVMPGEGDADIWPGRRHKLPVSPYVWTGWAGAPPVSRVPVGWFCPKGAAERCWLEGAGPTYPCHALQLRCNEVCAQLFGDYSGSIEGHGAITTARRMHLCFI